MHQKSVLMRHKDLKMWESAESACKFLKSSQSFYFYSFSAKKFKAAQIKERSDIYPVKLDRLRYEFLNFH